MERVSGDGFFSYRREIGQKKESRRSRGVGGRRTFESELEESRPAPVELPGVGDADDVQAAELLDAVFAAGDRLKRRTDSGTLEAYRQAVRRFVSVVVERSIEVEERTSGSTIARRKRYTLVKIIDAKLEQLAAGMIASQRTQLDVLARIDEINGLLIDLTH